MDNAATIRCRVAACRETLPPAGDAWSFYLINDRDVPLDAVLFEVSTEWGDMGSCTRTDVHVSSLQPGMNALLWRDDGEMRIELALRASCGARTVTLRFEFPKLYIQRNLQLIAGLAAPGLQVAAEG